MTLGLRAGALRTLAGRQRVAGPKAFPCRNGATASGPEKPAGGGGAKVPRATLPPKVKVEGRGVSITCGCGFFSLTFRNLKAARHGIFRCLICGWRQPLAGLLAGGRRSGMAAKDDTGI